MVIPLLLVACSVDGPRIPFRPVAPPKQEPPVAQSVARMDKPVADVGTSNTKLQVQVAQLKRTAAQALEEADAAVSRAETIAKQAAVTKEQFAATVQDLKNEHATVVMLQEEVTGAEKTVGQQAGEIKDLTKSFANAKADATRKDKEVEEYQGKLTEANTKAQDYSDAATVAQKALDKANEEVASLKHYRAIVRWLSGALLLFLLLRWMARSARYAKWFAWVP